VKRTLALVVAVALLHGQAASALASAKELTMEGQKREDAALAKAQKDLERNRKGDATVRVVDANGKPVPGAAVTVELSRHDFLFGCNIYMFDRFKTPGENEAYKRRFRELFNAATTGFYWRGYEPERGKPRYDYTDKVVAWCMERNIRLKGHPLLWATRHGEPRWSKGQPPPEVQEQRVQDIVKRYGGKIEFWEVVNEPAHLRGLKIDSPYRWAREADPNAYLIVNDYHVMADGYPPFFELLQQAKRSGVPFDGIGIQAHEPRTMRFPLERVQEILDRYATLGKELHITEFTPQSAGKPITGSHIQGKWDEAAQADYAVKFYTVCFAHPAVVAITWWDLCEQGSWLPGGGMLRKDLTPKPVYTALVELIHKTWHTRAEGKTDGAGRFAFRGFFGKYRVAVKSAGGRSEAGAHLAGGAKNEFSIAVSAR
jgi:GH35 family endo-1,4-beta-xylanase